MGTQSIRLLSLSLLLVLGASSCQSAGQNKGIALLEPSAMEELTDAADKNEIPTVALVMKTLTNPFFKEMEKGARQAEAEVEHVISSAVETFLARYAVHR